MQILKNIGPSKFDCQSNINIAVHVKTILKSQINFRISKGKLTCQQFQNTLQQFHQHQRLQILQQHLHQLLNRVGIFPGPRLTHQ